jgi:cell division septal protein FtsQ
VTWLVDKKIIKNFTANHKRALYKCEPKSKNRTTQPKKYQSKKVVFYVRKLFFGFFGSIFGFGYDLLTLVLNNIKAFKSLLS